MRTRHLVLTASVLAFAAACDKTSTGLSTSSVTLAEAFSTTPIGFSNTTNSFSAAGDQGMPFVPGGPNERRDGPGFGGLMGGGIADAFIGGVGFGPGIGRGPFGDDDRDGNCTFSSTTGVVTCSPVTRDGSLAVTRTFKFLTAANVAQPTRDSTTNTVIEATTVTGTVTFGAGMGRGRHLGIGPTRIDSIISATSTIGDTSSRTVTGLAAGSTTRTVNGSSAGHEKTTGTAAGGTFSIVRVAGDTTVGLVLPLPSGTGFPYPTAGKVTRSMSATVTLPGAAATTTTRREVVTYDGSATAKVVITQDGTTKNCTLPLPRGRLSCGG